MKQLIAAASTVLLICLLGACDISPAPAPVATDVPVDPAPLPSPGTAAPTLNAGAGRLTNGKVVLAVINDQTGIYADLGGRNALVAVQMAAEDFRAKYGDDALGGPVEVTSADHRDDPEQAAAKAREAYDQGGDVVLDVPTSPAALAVARVAAEKKKLYINVGAASADLSGAQCNHYTFHYAYDTYMLAAGSGGWVTQQFGKRWVLTYPNYVYGREMNKSFTAAIQAAGGSILVSVASPFPNTVGNFNAQLGQASSLKPDLLGVMQSGDDLSKLLKQYSALKLGAGGAKLAIGLLFDSDINALGPDVLAGALYTTPWLWTQDGDARAWADRFLKRTGVRPTFEHAGNYSAAWQYLEAVRRAGTDDADAMVKALEGYKFSDFFIHNGLVRMEDHFVAHDAVIAQVKSVAEGGEPWDYGKAIATLPADKGARPLSETGCVMR